MVGDQALLCSACRALESFNYDFELNPALSKWWAAHQKEDDARETAEKRKRLRWERARHLADTKPVTTMTAEEIALLREEGFF